MKRTMTLLTLFFVLQIQFFSQDTVPMSIKNNRFLIVEGTVNGNIQARFILDTGAGLEVVSGKFFEKIKDSATPAGILSGLQSIGTRVDLELYRIPSLKIGNYVKQDLVVAPYPDLDNYSGIDGFVSLNFFKDQPFTLDFVSRKLTLETPESLKSLAAKAESIPLYDSSYIGNRFDIFLPLLVNGKVKIMAEFDTGTGIEIMINPHFFKALGIDPLSDGVEKRSFQNPDGSSQPWYISRIASLSPLNSRLVEGNNLSAHFLKNFVLEGLIGWQLFKFKLVTIDIPNHRLLVRENPNGYELKTPQVVKMFPAGDGRNVPTNISEIFVEFDTDMSSMICLNMNDDEQKELLFKNVYWKTDKILAVKVEGSLKPRTRYTISLGIQNMCQLMDNFGGMFPVTRWSFTTK